MYIWIMVTMQGHLQPSKTMLTPISSSAVYIKTCVKRPLSKRPQIGFQNQLSLSAGQKYCRMLPFVIKILFVYFWVAVLDRFYCTCRTDQVLHFPLKGLNADCQSTFWWMYSVISNRWGIYMHAYFVCIDALCPSQQFFSHFKGLFLVFMGWTSIKQRI